MKLEISDILDNEFAKAAQPQMKWYESLTREWNTHITGFASTAAVADLYMKSGEEAFNKILAMIGKFKKDKGTDLSDVKNADALFKEFATYVDGAESKGELTFDGAFFAFAYAEKNPGKLPANDIERYMIAATIIDMFEEAAVAMDECTNLLPTPMNELLDLKDHKKYEIEPEGRIRQIFDERRTDRATKTNLQTENVLDKQFAAAFQTTARAGLKGGWGNYLKNIFLKHICGLDSTRATITKKYLDMGEETVNNILDLIKGLEDKEKLKVGPVAEAVEKAKKSGKITLLGAFAALKVLDPDETELERFKEFKKLKDNEKFIIGQAILNMIEDSSVAALKMHTLFTNQMNKTFKLSGKLELKQHPILSKFAGLRVSR